MSGPTVGKSQGHAIGIDLGGTNCRAALVDVHAGRVLSEAKLRVDTRDPEAVADLVYRATSEVLPREGSATLPVGIGFAGMLRGYTGIVENAPNFGWRGVDFRSALRARLGPSVELYNDLNAIAFGEARYGAASGALDLLCVYVGTGVGAGIVCDGKLYVGATHLAGELGHTKVVPGGRPCGCGQRGCIEAYVSGKNLETRLREELADGAIGQASLVVSIAGGREHAHAGHVDEAVQKGDPYALALWNEVGGYLGLVLANAVTLLNPAHVILGGGVWEGAPELRRIALLSYEALVNGPSLGGTQIGRTVLGDSAGMLGAAALAADGVISA